jgi:hypothetical protein
VQSVGQPSLLTNDHSQSELTLKRPPACPQDTYPGGQLGGILVDVDVDVLVLVEVVVEQFSL